MYLQIALPWLQLGFVGYLEVSEILILWDRVFGELQHMKQIFFKIKSSPSYLFYWCVVCFCGIGFMDNSILAALAVSIFVYRAQALFDCTRAAEVHRVLQEGNNLRVVPLLQLFLFIDDSDPSRTTS
jgi:hypothetical protein